MRSFEAVTGPKTDRWLVKTVGALALANGVAVAFGLRRDAIAGGDDRARRLQRGRVLDDRPGLRRAQPHRPVYLGDAALELALAAAILAGE